MGMSWSEFRILAYMFLTFGYGMYFALAFRAGAF
jgi:hypothetical protein